MKVSKFEVKFKGIFIKLTVKKIGRKSCKWKINTYMNIAQILEWITKRKTVVKRKFVLTFVLEWVNEKKIPADIFAPQKPMIPEDTKLS